MKYIPKAAVVDPEPSDEDAQPRNLAKTEASLLNYNIRIIQIKISERVYNYVCFSGAGKLCALRKSATQLTL